YGTVTGTITSAETGAPISGVRVALSNGFAGASGPNGVYTILVPAGSYAATAADVARNCTASSPASATVAPPGGGTVTQDFVMVGTSKIEANGYTIDDSTGNNDGIINRFECAKLNFGVKNNGCARETAISARLTTTTPGVTVVDRDSSYPDLPIDAGSTNVTPFKIFVASDFVCGTDIAFSLNLTYSNGTKSIPFSVPTCAGGPNQQIPQSQLTTSDSPQTDRIGRTGQPSTCAGRPSPGGGFTGTHYYKAFNFTNSAGAARCYTVTINAGLNGPGDIESVAYDQVYDPANIDTNYLGDTGISGLGTTVGQATYSFTVPAGHNFVVVVNTTGSNTSGTIASAPFSGTVSGFVNNAAGPGSCTVQPTPPTLTSAAIRVTHGAAGAFDVPLSLTGGSVEPRANNGNYTAVLHFDRTVQSGGVTLTGTGNAGSPTFSGNDMLVPLTGVANQQRVSLTATNVTASGGGTLASVGLQIGFLIGDSSNDGVVNAADAQQVRNRSGQATDLTNFRSDVNVDGTVNSGDTTIVRAQSGRALP
ncbi:MAG: dockerin type I domain-containing protein, partial [Verrucomicrobiota bacterium]|nr:dockerin type I domain-containing protein [Verrucomicrobiota bacterium]